ncbi:hypothetical protein PQR75_46740 [Paraburkholderia fungorum]|uniref:hypothetical protein n=1 Tax=Paraburkholderia fungorum TaxID=134537 RepID=UPI0038B7C919
MTSESNAKRKTAGDKKEVAKLWIAEWAIEPATTPGHVSVCFVVTKESGEGASRSATRRFLLRCERAEELVNELKEVLEDAAAIQCLEGQAGSSMAQLNLTGGPVGASDTEPLSNHFDLGAYGLVGN